MTLSIVAEIQPLCAITLAAGTNVRIFRTTMYRVMNESKGSYIHINVWARIWYKNTVIELRGNTSYHGHAANKHEDVISWERLLQYWFFARGIDRSPLQRESNVELCCFFVIKLNRLLKKQSSCRWFEISWRVCYANVIYSVTDVVSGYSVQRMRYCYEKLTSKNVLLQTTI